jgi:hypothetical protein
MLLHNTGRLRVCRPGSRGGGLQAPWRLGGDPPRRPQERVNSERRGFTPPHPDGQNWGRQDVKHTSFYGTLADSPPLRLPRALYTSMSMFSLRKVTLPSIKANWAPPGCWLPKLTSVKLLLPL